MTTKHKEITLVLNKINQTGVFDVVLSPTFDEIENIQFHKLRDRYRKAQEALRNYIIKHGETKDDRL